MSHTGRPFGGVEKLYLALDAIAVKTFALVAELDKQLPEEKLRPALLELIRRHPQLSYQIQKDNQFQFWFLHVKDCTIPFRSIAIDENTDWTGILSDELIRPFDLSQAPLIRIVLLQKPHSSVLILLSHHSLGDGISANIFLQDLLKIISGLRLDHLPVPKSMDESLKATPAVLSNFTPSSSPYLGKTKKWDIGKLFIEKYPFSEIETASLRHRCKINGTTVNSALNAAVATVLMEHEESLKGKPLVVRLPVSVRSTLDVQSDYALNVITKDLILQPENYGDFWDFARKIGAEMEGAASIEQVLGYVSFFRNALLQPVPFSEIVNGVEEKIETDFMLSNLGHVKEDTFGLYRILKLWGPVVVSGTGEEQTIGAVTIGGQLFMTNTSSSPIPDLLSKAAGLLLNS